MTRTRRPGHVVGAGSVPGDVIGGFGITAQIRVRGCRAIYRAEADGRVVVLKTLCRDAAAKAHRRFDNEAAALRLLHNVDRVPDLVATGTTGVQRYMAAEWCDGVTLRALSSTVSRGVAVLEAPAIDFADLATATADAVRLVHDAGVVHADLSRLNLLTDGKTVVPVDFESSLHSESPNRIARRITWAYAAPELTDGPPDVLSDQYSTAAVLYRQLTGRHCRSPRGDAPADSAEALHKPARPLPDRVSRRRPGLGEVLAQALSIDPRDRFDTMHSFTNALEKTLAP